MKSVRSNHFVSYFSEKGALALADAATESVFQDGEIIFEDRSHGDGVFLIMEGSVQLSRSIPGKTRVPITTVEPGDYFGEIAVLDKKPRSAQATSLGATRIAKIPSQVILEVLKEEPIETTFHLFERILVHLRNTNDKFAEEVLRKEKLHLIGEMAGMIIHDFKNPITAIQLSAEIVGTKHKDPSTSNRCKVIIQQSQRMVTMVQELLDFARGNLSITTESVSIGALFDQFKELNHDIFQHSHIEFVLEPLEASVQVNLERILRVIQNISMNAIEAMTAHQGKGRLHIFGKIVEPYVDLYVEDNGPGIPESIRETIFEPFVTHGKKTGTGLGMAIAKMIVDAHQGTISFTSEAGKGTTFVIRLPKA